MAFPRLYPSPDLVAVSPRAQRYFKRHSLDESITAALAQPSEWWAHHLPTPITFSLTDLFSQALSPDQADLLVTTALVKHHVVWPFAQLLTSRIDLSLPCYVGLSSSTLTASRLDPEVHGCLDVHPPIRSELFATVANYLVARLSPDTVWDDSVLDLLYKFTFVFDLTDAVDRASRPLNYYSPDPRYPLPPLPLSAYVVNHLLHNLVVASPAGTPGSHDEWVSLLALSALDDNQFAAVVPMITTLISSDRNIIFATLSTSLARLDYLLDVMGPGEYIDDLTVFAARYAHCPGYLERLLPHLAASARVHLLSQPLGLTSTTWPSSRLVVAVCPTSDDLLLSLLSDSALGFVGDFVAEDFPDPPAWYLARLLLRVPGLAAYLTASSNHPVVTSVVTRLAGPDSAAVSALLTNPAVTLAEALSATRALRD